MLNLWALAQAKGELHVKAQAPEMKSDEAKQYVESVCEVAIYQAVKKVYVWQNFLGIDVASQYFWDDVNSAQIARCVEEGSKHIYNALVIASASNKNLLIGMRAAEMSQESVKIKLVTMIEALKRDQSRMKVSEAAETAVKSVPTIAANTGTIISRAAFFDLVKANGLEPDVTNHVPKSREQVELFLSHGVVPAGYLSRATVHKFSRSIADEMRANGLPLIKASVFRRMVAGRAVIDIVKGAEQYAQRIEDRHPAILERLLDDTRSKSYDLLQTYKEVNELHGSGFEKGWSMTTYKTQLSELGASLGLADAGGRDIVKAFGRKKTEELTKKKIINKKGVLTTVLVREHDAPREKKSIGANLKGFFRVLAGTMKQHGHKVGTRDSHVMEHLFEGWSAPEKSDTQQMSRSLLDHIKAHIEAKRARMAARGAPKDRAKKPAGEPRKKPEVKAKPKDRLHFSGLDKATLGHLIESLTSLAGMSPEEAAKYHALTEDMGQKSEAKRVSTADEGIPVQDTPGFPKTKIGGGYGRVSQEAAKKEFEAKTGKRITVKMPEGGAEKKEPDKVSGPSGEAKPVSNPVKKAENDVRQALRGVGHVRVKKVLRFRDGSVTLHLQKRGQSELRDFGQISISPDGTISSASGPYSSGKSWGPVEDAIDAIGDEKETPPVPVQDSRIAKIAETKSKIASMRANLKYVLANEKTYRAGYADDIRKDIAAKEKVISNIEARLAAEGRAAPKLEIVRKPVETEGVTKRQYEKAAFDLLAAAKKSIAAGNASVAKNQLDAAKELREKLRKQHNSENADMNKVIDAFGKQIAVIDAKVAAPAEKPQETPAPKRVSGQAEARAKGPAVDEKEARHNALVAEYAELEKDDVKIKLSSAQKALTNAKKGGKITSRVQALEARVKALREGLARIEDKETETSDHSPEKYTEAHRKYGLSGAWNYVDRKASVGTAPHHGIVAASAFADTVHRGPIEHRQAAKRLSSEEFGTMMHGAMEKIGPASVDTYKKHFAVELGKKDRENLKAERRARREAEAKAKKDKAAKQAAEDKKRKEDSKQHMTKKWRKHDLERATGAKDAYETHKDTDTKGVWSVVRHPAHTSKEPNWQVVHAPTGMGISGFDGHATKKSAKAAVDAMQNALPEDVFHAGHAKGKDATEITKTLEPHVEALRKIHADTRSAVKAKKSEGIPEEEREKSQAAKTKRETAEKLQKNKARKVIEGGGSAQHGESRVNNHGSHVSVLHGPSTQHHKSVKAALKYSDRYNAMHDANSKRPGLLNDEHKAYRNKVEQLVMHEVAGSKRGHTTSSLHKKYQRAHGKIDKNKFAEVVEDMETRWRGKGADAKQDGTLDAGKKGWVIAEHADPHKKAK